MQHISICVPYVRLMSSLLDFSVSGKSCVHLICGAERYILAIRFINSGNSCRRHISVYRSHMMLMWAQQVSQQIINLI